jgi:CHAT domain-containing protein
MVSIGHGFLAAGASKVVVSLWRVADAPTALLMSEFYHGMLEKDLSPATALRAAKNHLRTETPWSAPYYWAGFILQGDWQ